MKSIELLILFLLVKLYLFGSLATTQHSRWSYGQIKLMKNKQRLYCRYFCPSNYKLQLNESTTKNNTITREFLVNDIECSMCKIPFNKNSCTQPCDQLQFGCIWRNLGCNNFFPTPTHTTVTVTQVVYPTTTNAIADTLPHSAGHTDTSIMALDIITGLLSLLVLLLTAGWIWTCWIMKKRGKILSRTNGTGLSQRFNGHSTSHPHYENNIMDKDTKFESSAIYSLLTPENETNSGTDGGKVTNGGDEEYCMLDRSCGKAKTTARQQKQQLDGYSRLFSN